MRSVEGVQSHISGVVVWEQAGVDDLLGVCFRDAETFHEALGLVRDRSFGVGREGSTIVCYVTEHAGDVGGAAVLIGDVKVLCVYNGAVDDNVASHSVRTYNGLRRGSRKTGDLSIEGCLVAADFTEDLLACDGVGLTDGKIF